MIQPHLKRTWCIGTIDSLFIAKMEQILQLYGQPYNPLYPVICFDERPCFLIGDKIEPLTLQRGQLRKEHYAYEKFGSCALLAAIEPLTGKRCARVYSQRTKKEFTLFCQALEAAYPEAIVIHLVLDNLNTHNASAFYESLPADEALALANRFVFHYTPKSASWLNMIEIEFSALSRICLDRRIPTLLKLEQEVMAIINERHQKRIKIHWQFSLDAARGKLNRHYRKANPLNQIYQKI